MELFGVHMSEKIYMPLIIIIAALIFNIILKCIVNSKIKISTKLSKHEQRSRKTVLLLIQSIVKTLIIVVAVLAILQVFGVNTSALVAGVGALSLVVGLAFQDLLKDYLVGALIVIERQFAIGEIVKINNFKGEVIELTLRITKLKSLTGEIYIIPNRSISSVVNYSLANKVLLIDVGVSYESDMEKVEKVLNDVCLKLKETTKEIKGDVVLNGLNSLDNSAVVYTLSIPVSEKDIYFVKRKSLKEIKMALDKNNIKIPYPQLEVHYDK